MPRWTPPSFVAAAFIGSYFFSSLDHGFSRSKFPFSIVMFEDFLVALRFFIVFLVFKENTCSAATIEVTADQKVISTGPYALVCHPMYSGALVTFRHPARAWILVGTHHVYPMTLVIVWPLLDEKKNSCLESSGYARTVKKSAVACCLSCW
jgi:protein-S-isoprenylcysteine O-methyltransferase Ste14